MLPTLLSWEWCYMVKCCHHRTISNIQIGWNQNKQWHTVYIFKKAAGDENHHFMQHITKHNKGKDRVNRNRLFFKNLPAPKSFWERTRREKRGLQCSLHFVRRALEASCYFFPLKSRKWGLSHLITSLVQHEASLIQNKQYSEPQHILKALPILFFGASSFHAF